MIYLGKKLVHSLSDEGLFIFQVVIAVVYGALIYHTITHPSLMLIVAVSVMLIPLVMSVIFLLKMIKAKIYMAYNQGVKDGLP